MRRSWSIRTHLIGLVLAIVLPLGALGAYTIYTDIQAGVERAEGNSLNLAHATAATLEQFLEDAHRTLHDLSEHPDVRSMDPERCNHLLGGLIGFFPQYTNAFVTDLEGRLICSGLVPREEPEPLPPGTEWFEEILATEHLVIGKPHLGILSGHWNSVLAHPLRGEEGGMEGVVAVSVDLIRFQELLRSAALPVDALVTIEDRDGTVVARSQNPEEWVGRRLPESDIPSEVLMQPSGLTRAPSADGVDRLWGFVAVSGSPWRVWAGIPTDSIYGPVRSAAIPRVAFALLVLLGACLLAFSLYRRISVSLETLADDVGEAAQGGSWAPTVSGPAEVVEVATQFDRTLRARSEAEKAHRTSLERYRTMMENAVFGMYISTPAGRFLEVNPALVDMLGYDSREELLATPLPALYRHPEERDRLMDAHRNRKSIEGVEVEWVRKDDAAIRVRLSGSVIRNGDTAYEVFAEDVTDRHLLEEQVRQAQKMEAVGRLAGGVAHDFNNLLTVIMGAADLLVTDLDPDHPLRGDAQSIREAASRGAALTRQLLAFSRKQVLQPVTLELNETVRQMKDMLDRLVGSDVGIRLVLDPGVRPVLADPGQLQQVVMNLVLNARDATEGPGSVEIRTGNVTLDEDAVRGHSELSPGPYVALSVQDEGTGISPTHQKRIFEPFFTTKPDGKGTGLGLATVYGIATQSGGHVTVRTQPGRGSTFTVYLPPAETQSPVEVAARGAGPEASNPARNPPSTPSLDPDKKGS